MQSPIRRASSGSVRSDSIASSVKPLTYLEETISSPVEREDKESRLALTFLLSDHSIPQEFLVAPSLKDHFDFGLYESIRLLMPCQGPSIRGDSYHVTSHKGYTIRYPKDRQHRYQREFDMMTTYLSTGAGIAAGFLNLPSGARDLATSVLTTLDKSRENRTRMNAAGIDPTNMTTTQLIRDNHQKEATKELLIDAAALNGETNITGGLTAVEHKDGRILWVCKDCHDSLWRGIPIDMTDHLAVSEYAQLVKRDTEVTVTLRNRMSVRVLSDTFTRPSETRKLVINIDPWYFEDPVRATGAPFNSIKNHFNKLGEVLKHQRFSHLEIRATSTTNSEVYSGLRAAFDSPSLESLHVYKMSRFLQGEITITRSQQLKELILEEVLANTNQMAANLGSVIRMNPDLKRLKVTQSKVDALLWVELVGSIGKQLVTLELEMPAIGLSEEATAILLSSKRVTLADHGSGWGW